MFPSEAFSNKQIAKRITGFVRVAFIGVAYFLITDIALYLLNPGYELIRASAGDYHVGPYRPLIASAFFSRNSLSITCQNCRFEPHIFYL
jgi:hypothetical protein